MQPKPNHKFVINFFFVVVILTSISDTIERFIPTNGLLNYLDELFIVFSFVITIKKNIIRTDKKIWIVLILFVLCGFISGIRQDVPLKIMILGCFLTIKGVLLYITFSNITFNKNDINLFIKLMSKTFPVILLFCIVEILLGNRYLEFFNLFQRGTFLGMRTLGSIFRVQSTLAFYGFVMFLIYRFFIKSKKKSITSFLLVFAPFKIKEAIGAIFSYYLCRTRKINVKVILGGIIVGLGCWYLYKTYYPSHYNQYFSGNTDIARVALMDTSFKISMNEFPLGEGFGRFGSATSKRYYSPVYKKYNIDTVWGLNHETNDSFIQDTFYPMIIGETGILGLFFWCILLACIFYSSWKGFYSNRNQYNSTIFLLFIFMVLSSLAKPTFVQAPHNLILFGLVGMMNKYCLQKRNFYILKN